MMAVGPSPEKMQGRIFLGAEDEVKFMGEGQLLLAYLAQSFDQYRHANAIIQCLCYQPLSQFLKRTLKYGHVPDAHRASFPVRDAKIDEHLLKRRVFTRIAEALTANHTKSAIEKTQPATQTGSGAHRANWQKTGKAVIVNVCDDHSNLVDMRRQHNPQAVWFFITSAHNQIAQIVHTHVIGERLYFNADD